MWISVAASSIRIRCGEMSDTHFDVEIPGDDDEDKTKTPEAAVNGAKGAPPVAAKEEAPPPEKTEPEIKEPTPEEAVAALKAQLASSEMARQAAEARAREASGNAANAEKAKADTDLQLVTTAIDTVKANQESLKARLKEAYAAGDTDAIADIQSEIGTNGAKLFNLEQGKQALEAAKAAPAKSQPIIDPVESLAGQMMQGGNPRSAGWIRAHPQFVQDPRLYQRMLAAHNMVMTSDTPPAPDSEDYINQVEAALGISPSAPALSAQGDFGVKSSPLSRAAPAAAPVTRSGRPEGGRPNTVRLSADEVEMAEAMGLTKEEYAKHKLALQNEGRMTRQ